MAVGSVGSAESVGEGELGEGELGEAELGVAELRLERWSVVAGAGTADALAVWRRAVRRVRRGMSRNENISGNYASVLSSDRRNIQKGLSV
jgi:hypothetical protein